MKITKFDGHSFSPDYVATLMGGASRSLPGANVVLTPRLGRWPLASGLDRQGRRISLGISIEGADVDALYAQLCQWFDPEAEIPKVLTVTDDDGTDERYLEVACEALQPQDEGIKTIYVATLAVHDEVRWRAVTGDSDTWAITASGQTKAITNGGTEKAFPVFQLTPTATKTGGFTYKRWVPIKWLSGNSTAQYPVMASLDTATLVTAGKMQADGDDLRIIVEGVGVDRWLDAMNTSATKIWFNLNFSPAHQATLKVAIPASGPISAIEVNEDISQWPTTGIVLIGNEAFAFGGKDDSRLLLSDITRAVKGTSEASHDVDATVDWIQHDIWIVYGNSSVGAPTVDDRYKPCFELDHSTNTSWVYEVFGQMSTWGPEYFGSAGELRTARWGRYGDLTLSGISGCYTGAQEAMPSPYTVAGAWIGGTSAVGVGEGWFLINPCGIVNAAWTNGQKRRATASYDAHIAYLPRGKHAWVWQYDIPSPTNINTWEAWSKAADASPWSPPADKMEIVIYWYPGDVEVGDVTVTLNDAETPVVTVNAEQDTYTLDATITNVTTGEAIQVAFEMEQDETLEIDTFNKTVTYLKDGMSQFQAITFLGGIRRDWLALAKGANTLKFEDAGTAGVTMVTTFKKRYY